MGYAAEAGDRDQRRIGVEPVLNVERRADSRIMRPVIDRAADRVHLDEPERSVHPDEAGSDGGAAPIVDTHPGRDHDGITGGGNEADANDHSTSPPLAYRAGGQ